MNPRQPLPADRVEAIDSEALAASDRRGSPRTARRSTSGCSTCAGLVGYTDFFVVCSGNTERQTKAIHDAVYQELKDEMGLLPRRAEGAGEARWILLDYLDCVVHVFTPDAREFYRLENLWGDAPQRVVE